MRCTHMYSSPTSTSCPVYDLYPRNSPCAHRLHAFPSNQLMGSSTSAGTKVIAVSSGCRRFFERMILGTSGDPIICVRMLLPTVSGKGLTGSVVNGLRFPGTVDSTKRSDRGSDDCALAISLGLPSEGITNEHEGCIAANGSRRCLLI